MNGWPKTGAVSIYVHVCAWGVGCVCDVTDGYTQDMYMCEYVTACYVHTGAVCGEMKWLAEIGAVSVGMCVLGEGGGGEM